jgi:hypothetical protein
MTGEIRFDGGGLPIQLFSLFSSLLRAGAHREQSSSPSNKKKEEEAILLLT